jgi:hypothetical protein
LVKSGFVNLQKSVKKIITLMLVAHFLINGAVLVIMSKSDPISIVAEYGIAPDIDGAINTDLDEWNDAVKQNLYLYRNLTDLENRLQIELWIMQTKYNLFISIQFELQDHNSQDYNNELIGILISDSESIDQEDFIDAKIVQFNNISSGEFVYTDYYINNNNFYNDSMQDGIGAAKLEGNEIVYEFSLPINKKNNNTEDVYLYYGPSSPKAFKIVFGISEIHYEEFILQNDVIIELQFSPIIPPSLSEIFLLIFNIIIFSAIGGFYTFYIYRLTQLKKEIKRIKT